MTRRTLIAKLIILIVTFFVVAALCWAAIASITGRFSFNFFHAIKGSGPLKLVSTEEYSPTDFNSIDVKSSAYDITVSSGTDKIVVSYYSNSTDSDDKLDITEAGSTLKIDKSVTSVFGFNTYDARIEISVPDKSEYNYFLYAISGDIDINSFASELELTTVSGTVSCLSDKAKNATINTTSGDVKCSVNCQYIDINTTSGKISSSVPTENLNVNTVSGDVTATLSNITNICDINTVSGEAYISLTTAVNGYSVDYASTSGDLDDRVDNRKSDNDTEYSVGNGNTRIEVNTISGDLDINK